MDIAHREFLLEKGERILGIRARSTGNNACNNDLQFVIGKVE